MSKTKGVRILGRLAWVWDNSHDIVVARMVEAAESLDSIAAEMISDWRVWASVRDLAFQLPTASGAQAPAVVDVLARARSAIEAHGDVEKTDLVGWSVLDGVEVSGGFLRTDVLPVAALLDVVSGFDALLDGTLEPDPPRSWWLFGSPTGQTIARRRE